MTPLLTHAQRQQFTRFPSLDERLLAQYYLLSEADLKQIMNRRRDFNRLGYAVQLTVLRHLGRGLTAGEQPLPEVLEFLSEQLILTLPVIPGMPPGPTPGMNTSLSCVGSSVTPNSAAV